MTVDVPTRRRAMSTCPPWCSGHNYSHQPWQNGADGELERLHGHYRRPNPDSPVWAGVLAVEDRTALGEAGVVLELDDTEVRLTVDEAKELAAYLIGMARHAAAWNDERAGAEGAAR